MAVELPHVVVSHAEFVARRERLRRVASELRRQEAARTIEAVAVPAADVRPAAVPEDDRRRDLT